MSVPASTPSSSSSSSVIPLPKAPEPSDGLIRPQKRGFWALYNAISDNYHKNVYSEEVLFSLLPSLLLFFFISLLFPVLFSF
jgi:hypothetical protein